MDQKWQPFALNFASEPMREAMRQQEDVSKRLSRLLSVGVGVYHINRCSRIGYALGKYELRPNSETCCDFLDGCFNRICAGMPLDEFCTYIDDYENAEAGIEKAPRAINTPWIVEQKPVSVGYSIEDATNDAIKAHDAFVDALRFGATPNETRNAILALGERPQPKKNALRFLDGLGSYSKFRRR